MTHAGGLWQRTFKEVGEEYPQMEKQHMYVDALCMQMIRDPRGFDVIVTNNMFGDIITDLAAACRRLGRRGERQSASGEDLNVWSRYMARRRDCWEECSQSIRRDFDCGHDVETFGATVQAEKIEVAVLEAVRKKKTTPDIGGSLGTSEAGEWIADFVSHQ